MRKRVLTGLKGKKDIRLGCFKIVLVSFTLRDEADQQIQRGIVKKRALTFDGGKKKREGHRWSTVPQVTGHKLQGHR